MAIKESDNRLYTVQAGALNEIDIPDLHEVIAWQDGIVALFSVYAAAKHVKKVLRDHLVSDTRNVRMDSTDDTNNDRPTMQSMYGFSPGDVKLLEVETEIERTPVPVKEHIKTIILCNMMVQGDEPHVRLLDLQKTPL